MNADPSPSTRSASESSPAGEGDATPQLPSKRRASKACESCRISRQRCSGDEPCTRCSVRRMECNYRQKARPGRAPRGSLRAGLSEGEGGMRRQQAKEPAVIGIRAVEKDVERLYLAKTGHTISLALPDTTTHPSLLPEAPLPILPNFPSAQTDAYLEIFAREVLDFFTFLSHERLLQLAKRHRDLPSSLGEDQMALLLAVYALGAFRLESFSRVQGAEGPTHIDPESPRADIAFFRHALRKSEATTTVTALHALVVLQLYAMATCSVSTTRSLIGKMVYLVQELGLHRKTTAAAYPPETGASVLLFHTTMTDTYYAGLVGERPFLPSFDSELISARAHEGLASPIMSRLVLLEREFLMGCHSGKKDIRSSSFALGFEGKLWEFMQEFGGELGDSTSMSSSFATTHYHWQRILIRAPCAVDHVLGLSSLPIMVRSASHILSNYLAVFNSQRYINCAWPVLARVVGAGHVLIQALARDELRRSEAQELLGVVLYLLGKLETRWTAATSSQLHFRLMIAAFELDVASISSPDWPAEDRAIDANPALDPPPLDTALLPFPFDPSTTSTTFDFSETDGMWMLNHMHEMWGASEQSLPVATTAAVSDGGWV